MGWDGDRVALVHADDPDLRRMAVLDAVANNADRKGGHCLLDDRGRIWGIDHGLCFHEEYKMRTVIWDWSEAEVPEPFLDELERQGLPWQMDEHDVRGASVPGEASFA